MAISPKTRYPAQIDTTDPTGYPEGKARDVTVPDDGTGTPFQQDMLNDIFGMQQAILDAGATLPSGTPDKVGASQYLDALRDIADQQIGAAWEKNQWVSLPMDSGQPVLGAAWTLSDGGVWQSPVAPNLTKVSFPLLLPQGSEIKGVEAIVDESIARSTGDRMELQIEWDERDWYAPGTGGVTDGGVLGNTESDASAVREVIRSAALSQAVDRGIQTYRVTVRCGSAGGFADLLYGVRVYYLPPSPVDV